MEGVLSSSFGAKVTGQVPLTAGTNVFRVLCTGPFQLYLNGVLVINDSEGKGISETPQVRFSHFPYLRRDAALHLDSLTYHSKTPRQHQPLTPASDYPFTTRVRAQGKV